MSLFLPSNRNNIGFEEKINCCVFEKKFINKTFVIMKAEFVSGRLFYEIDLEKITRNSEKK